MKRATSLSLVTAARSDISIHALVKRATIDFKNLLINVIISIHALVKRATFRQTLLSICRCHFNPRPREEGDYTRQEVDAGTKNFNPRPREEGDYDMPTIYCEQQDFNPRPREEGDICFTALLRVVAWISIHALVKRATCRAFCFCF